MSTRALLLLSPLLLTLATRAQQAAAPTPLTEALLLAQRPESIALEQWRVIIRKPTTAVLYPIQLTQAMLDTLDMRQLDIRYQYMLVPNLPVEQQPDQADKSPR